ncbi:hypothetical protein [Bradyrhizobium sp.]|jgi:hypothetical protein|uniref:hypothetical protein n=1 Tax=Bradyrhizobium sp. TaxID=376 RepID=UPI002DDD22D9|nr:hypothetical protein [Bradyrhizobium sp.]HEV2153694.1 hypothetical protein [Bradyrhizobium sp.]
MLLLRIVREIDAVHLSNQVDVGDDQGRALRLQRERGSLGVLALQHLEIAFLEQRREHLALNVVVLDDDRGRADRF